MAQESRRLEQSALIELFEVDATVLGGGVYRFHAGTNELRENVVFDGQTYIPYPVQATGFSMSSGGKSARPKLTLSNITGFITGMVNDYEDLVGAVVSRVLVFAKHLDAENFVSGNPLANPSQQMRSKFIIERCSGLSSDFASFELALPSETDGAMIPARMITTDVCMWNYRSADCSYVGGAIADDKDVPTDDLVKDKCGKRLSSCKLRFGEHGILPFGGFPTAVRHK
jgi:lambda family phage minor tail protein L